MNHDENNPPENPPIAPELEARIVAWIAGEASAFEAAELDRLIAEKPELATFKQQLENVHALVGEAVHPDKDPLRLSAERRAKLLAAIQETDTPVEQDSAKSKARPSEKDSVVLPMNPVRRRAPKWWQRGTLIAAGLAVGFTLQAVFRSSDTMFDRAALTQKEHEPVSREEIRVLDAEAHREAARSAIVAGERRKREKLPEPEPPLSSSDALAENKTTPDTPEVNYGPPVKLDPFKVTADANRGYYSAPKTLAGTRLQVELKDVMPAPPIGNPSTFGPGNSRISTFAGGALAGKNERREESTTNRVTFGQNLANNASNQNNAPGTTFRSVEGRSDTPAKPEPSASVIPPSPTDDTIILSPFEVSAQKSTAALNYDKQLRDAAAPASDDVVKLDKFVATETASIAQDKKSQIDVVSNGSLDLGAIHSTNDLPAAAPAPKTAFGFDKPIFDSPRSNLTSEKEDKPLARPTAQTPLLPSTEEIPASKEPVSTFSLHVSDVSFRLAQVALARGEKPDPASIRPEEFYNAFDYGDPNPAMAEKISCRIEQSGHPTLQQRNLVRIAMKVAAAGRGATQPLHLTLLLDRSGSMEREDRAAAVHRALEVLVSLLGPNDRVTLIGFARQPRLLAEEVPGDQAAKLLQILTHTPAEGGTNLEEALKLGTQLAKRHQDKGAQNRIVLLTDGAANLGDADPARLSASIVALRQQGIAFDACGVGLDGIDDTMLESLTRKGDGRYYVLNTPESADANFARQLAGAFRPAAENVKVQVRFNPSRVGHYRLLGFDQHRLKEEDFRNDKVDAAELAAEEAAVALYQVEVLPQGEGELGEVYVRFRDTASGEMVERSWTLSYDAHAPVFEKATPTMQLAGVSELLAEKLRGGPNGDAIKLDDLGRVMNALRGRYAHEPRVQELVKMYEQMRRMKP